MFLVLEVTMEIMVEGKVLIIQARVQVQAQVLHQVVEMQVTIAKPIVISSLIEEAGVKPITLVREAHLSAVVAVALVAHATDLVTIIKY